MNGPGEAMRGALSVQGLRKTFGAFEAVSDVSFDVRPGEFLTLLGPSGCGKTTLLRLIAGFDTPEAGRILISGHDVAALPPHARPVNTVFQHYALFPHRSVAGNVAFGLEMGRRPPAEIRERVDRALELVRLSGLHERRIDQLSGGERQRVALARAMVLEPEVLLLDEPMSALDLKLRKEMQVELKNLQARLGITFVFVTHDQDEALVMSDRIAVMSRGRIEQLAAPEELYERPRTRFVAEFLAVKNVLRARVVSVANGGARLRIGDRLELAASGEAAFNPGQEVWVGVRPERITLGASGNGGVDGVIEDEIYLGDRTDWRVRVGDVVLTVAEHAETAAARRIGDTVGLSIAPRALLALAEPGAGAPARS